MSPPFTLRDGRRLEPLAPIGDLATQAEDSTLASPPNQEELAIFATNSLDLRCIAGLDGYFKWLDPRWSQTLGWSRQELMEKPFLKFVHPEDHLATASEMDGLSQGDRTVYFENRYLCRDGRFVPLEWNAVSPPGRHRIYAVARDISHQRSLQKEILEASDLERARLGRDLHDGLCQNLAGIAALSATLARKLGEGPEAADALEIKELLNKSITDARDLALGLTPINLRGSGLACPLHTFATNVEALFAITCRFQGGKFREPLPADTEMHLYRIAQEAVSNAISHGRGKVIEITLQIRGHQGWLTVSDDGIGIKKGDALSEKSLGMHTMNYRARLIGGSLTVEPLLPHGTVVTCVFPVAFTSVGVASSRRLGRKEPS